MPRITRQFAKIDFTNVRAQSAGVGGIGGVDVDVSFQGADAFMAELNKFLSGFTLVNRRRIAKAGAPYLINAAQNLAPNSPKVHYRYNTAKLIKSIRAPKGYGRKLASYYPGNLDRSIIDIGDKRRRVAKGYKVVIGPYYLSWKQDPKGEFKGKRFDAYYAHMVYGSARAFQQRVMIAALNTAKAQIRTAMISEAVKVQKELVRGNEYLR